MARLFNFNRVRAVNMFQNIFKFLRNVVKIVRVVLEIYERCVHGQTDRQLDFFTNFRPIYIVFSCPKIGVLKSFERFSRFTRVVFTDRMTDRQTTRFFTR